MPLNQPILTDLLTNVRNDVINSLQSYGRFATGQTIANLEIVTTETGGQLLAPFWIDALEVGRKPTSEGAQLGDPPMIDGIKAWIETKGLDINPWAVKKSIDKKGYPGKPGVLTEPLELADAHINSAIEKIAMNQQKEILDLFNVFDEI